MTPLLLLSLLGAVALSLYGMKVMSQGILKVAGSQMRASLRHISHNRLANFWTGTWITAVIQSSSAMTIMAVGLVNAGLLSVSQSIALMMGANIGTTLSAWIIALVGFVWEARWLAIPLIVVALPFTYATRLKARPWGEMLMGVALYVLGFTTFISMMPSPDEAPAAAQVFQTLSAWGYGSVLLFVLAGILITCILRSSAATILLAMALVAREWLVLPMALALVIGDNVGTTLSAVLASRRANVSARRAAWSHVLFNVFGMLWALVLVYPISEVTWQFVSLGTGFPSPAALAIGVALFHTAFNLVTALLLIGVIPQLKALLARFLPISDSDEDELSLQFIQGGLLSTAELSIEEARKEAVLFGVRCQRMMQLTADFMHLSADHPQSAHIFSRIEKYEKITDRLELEIVRYLSQLDTSTISDETAARIRSLLRIVDELESIGDACYKLACLVVRRHEHKATFIPMQQQNIDKMLRLVNEALDQMVVLLKKPAMTEADLQRAYNQEDAINALRGQLRELNIASVQSGDYSYQSGTFYMDIINGCEKIGDYVVNVIEAHAGSL